MLLIGDLLNTQLSDRLGELLHLPVEYPEIYVFADSEKRVRLLQEVVDQDVLILRSLQAPVDSHLIEYSFLIDAVKRGGAKSVYGITPYFAYQRADHVFRAGEAVPLEAVIKMVEACGLDRSLIADPHSIKLPELFIIPVDTVSAVQLFAAKIHEMMPDLSKISVVSPDNGGIRSIRILSEKLGNCPWMSISKERDREMGTVLASGHEGEVKETCFIVDDIISTGGTVIEAINYLIERGARTVYVMATHPVFAGEATSLLQNSNAVRVFVTDSLGIPEEKRFDKLEILSLAPIIAEKIKDIDIK